MTQEGNGRDVHKGRGRFIVFEGLDGSGSTTQLSRLAGWLADHGVKVERTKEPSNGPLGAALRQAIEGRVVLDNIALALAFAADRADHLFNSFNGIEKTLAEGSWVLCDRYVLSSLAYQTDEALDPEWILSINRFAVEPDLTIFIDTSTEICLERIGARSSQIELFHDAERMERTLRNYRKVVADGRLIGSLITVNGNKDIDDVFGGVLGEFMGWLSKHDPDRLQSLETWTQDEVTGSADSV